MEDEFDVEILENPLESDDLDLLAMLDSDPEFQNEIESLIKLIHDENFTLANLHKKISDLIELSAQKLILKEKLRGFLEHLKGSSGELKRRIDEISAHLMLRRNLGIYTKGADIKKFIITKACENLKAMMKRFVIYEIYKFLNPRRIAGKTKLENFIINYLLRGEKIARKFEGGSDADLKNYSPALLKKLRLKRKQLVSGSGGLKVKPK